MFCYSNRTQANIGVHKAPLGSQYLPQIGTLPLGLSAGALVSQGATSLTAQVKLAFLQVVDEQKQGPGRTMSLRNFQQCTNLQTLYFPMNSIFTYPLRPWFVDGVIKHPQNSDWEPSGGGEKKGRE
jgi:hypothetical protein